MPRIERALAGGILAGVLIAPAAHAQTSPITAGTITVKLTQAATINTATDGTPQDLTYAPDNSGRLFIATRNGDIRILSGGSVSATPFLNMASAGVSVYTGGEGGLLGLAFSPTFATDGGKFYTFTTEPFSTSGPAADFSHPELFPTTSVQPNNQIVIREWTAGAGNVANSSSRVLLRINHPQSNHQGGGIHFGPDGNLYISLGDGGGGNDFTPNAGSLTDGHTNSVGNGQDTTVPFGKILRINPNGNNSANGQYGIPADNPFASGAGGNMKEIYAYGLRNPYRFSFDSATGKLFAGDVGQSNREEVDTIVNGGNYGWPFREGTRDNSADAGRTTPVGFASLPPIAEYTHGDGDAILGGFVYRGATIPALAGKYVFGDLDGTAAKGRLFYTDAAGGPISELTYSATGLTPPSELLGFGEGPAGDLYALFANGSVLAITVPEPGTALAFACLGPLLLARRRLE